MLANVICRCTERLIIVLVEGLVELVAEAIIRLFKVVATRVSLGNAVVEMLRFFFLRVGEIGEVVVQRECHLDESEDGDESQKSKTQKLKMKMIQASSQFA